MSTQDEVLAEHTRAFVAEVRAVLEPVKTDVSILVEHGRVTNERLTAIEHRLSVIERHVGLNGGVHADTEPAPATQPENERPEEPGG